MDMIWMFLIKTPHECLVATTTTTTTTTTTFKFFLLHSVIIFLCKPPPPGFLFSPRKAFAGTIKEWGKDLFEPKQGDVRPDNGVFGPSLVVWNPGVVLVASDLSWLRFGIKSWFLFNKQIKHGCTGWWFQIFLTFGPTGEMIQFD